MQKSQQQLLKSKQQIVTGLHLLLSPVESVFLNNYKQSEAVS